MMTDNFDKYLKYAESTRAAFAGYDNVRDSSFAIPETVNCFRDIRYGSENENLLDIYYPAEDGSPDKTIVSVHGGAYVYGDKERYRFYCADLAARGFTVVNFSYRLAPETAYPGAVEDVNSVFRFIEEQGREHLIDSDKLFIVGDSAGAQIASQYTAMLTNRAYGRLFGLELPDIRVKGCGFNCGMYDMRSIMSGEHSEMFDAYFQGKEIELAEQLNVMESITPDFPPSFIMTAYYDFLRDDALLLASRLDELGVKNRYKLYGSAGQEHMGHVFHLNIALDEAVCCNDEECRFFDELLF
ncbi:MAG: alpha/beta hydrolase [Alistipes sp.]|nr:alpha/beta hydrolase [Alistipes sp.]